MARGMRPFAAATVEAGPTSYWHRRASGADPQAMIVEDYLPLLGQRGLDVRRFALHGESMGGYGCLLLAQRLGPRRVAAVAKLAGIPLRIVCGTLDPFYDASRAFAAGLTDPPAQTSWAQACHTPGYWRAETPGQLRFLAGHLA